MPGPNTPTSHNLTAAASTVGSWQLPTRPSLITVTNEGTANAWVTVDGTAPTVNGDNEYFVPTGGYEEIPITEIAGTAAITIQGISTQALSLWVEVDQ